jgi:hypothetical protein
MKRDEFQTLIQKFGFSDITKNESQGYYRRIIKEEERETVIRKFKLKQCYISLDDEDIRISFNNPAYTFHTKDISIPEIQSLFYYLTIVSNRKFAIKKENPDICKIHEYFEKQGKSFATMTTREKRRYSIDIIDFNKIKDLIS